MKDWRLAEAYIHVGEESGNIFGWTEVIGAESTLEAREVFREDQIEIASKVNERIHTLDSLHNVVSKSPGFNLPRKNSVKIGESLLGKLLHP